MVSMDDGAKVGTVDVLLVDPKRLLVTALVLTGATGSGVLPFESIRAIGADAVTIDSTEPIQWTTEPLPTEAGRRSEEILGLKVIDAGGVIGGTVHDLSFDSAGAVTSIDVRSGGVFGLGGKEQTVPASTIRGIGASLVTVDAFTSSEGS